MIYYFNIILIFFKLFLTQFIFYVENTSYIYNLILLTLLIILIIIIRYIKNTPTKELLLDHIMWYRYTYDFERYYSLFIVIFSLALYISTIIYLRICSNNKTINLFESKEFLIEITHKLPLIILLTIICIFILGFYLIFILIANCIRKYINLELVKLHFYYLDKPLYEKSHNKFKFDLSITKLYSKFNFLYFFLCHQIALGYQINGKNKPFRFATKEEDTLIENSWLYKKIKPYYFKPFLYNLHYIVLLNVLLYDIIFNQYTIQYTFKVLPYLFVYQLYVMASKFTEEKTLSDICADVNIMFYHSVIFLEDSDKFALIDGEITEPPFNWIERFIQYEVSGFTKIC